MKSSPVLTKLLTLSLLVVMAENSAAVQTANSTNFPYASPNAENSSAFFSPPEAAKLRGKVIDGETGEGLPGANLVLIPANRADSTHRAVAGAEGQFALDDLSPDVYLIIASYYSQPRPLASFSPQLHRRGRGLRKAGGAPSRPGQALSSVGRYLSALGA